MPYEIRTERTFAASHTLRLPDGTREPLHGHNWRVRVTVASDRLDAMDCVMDFHELERQLDAVVGPWHNRHLDDAEPFAGGAVNPSAERVAEAVARGVSLPAGVRLVSVEVSEAPGCVAVYRP